jgi:hypothetical protein
MRAPKFCSDGNLLDRAIASFSDRQLLAVESEIRKTVVSSDILCRYDPRRVYRPQDR